MKSLREKFDGRYVVDEVTGCWNWVRGKFRGGYGAIAHGKKTLKAHRVSYELRFGPIPEGLLVCHNCDNPSCVNPDHLFLGTSRDNTKDMFAKGRNPDITGKNNPMHGRCGEKNPFFGKTHSDETKRFLSQRQLGVQHCHSKLTNEKALDIFKRPNERICDLARKHGVSNASVWQVRNGYSWTHVTGLSRVVHPSNKYAARKDRLLLNNKDASAQPVKGQS